MGVEQVLAHPGGLRLALGPSGHLGHVGRSYTSHVTLFGTGGWVHLRTVEKQLEQQRSWFLAGHGRDLGHTHFFGLLLDALHC